MFISSLQCDKSVIWHAILAGLLSGCVLHSSNALAQVVNERKFPVVLDLDLSEDSHPRASLKIQGNNRSATGDVNVKLPFKITKVFENEKGLFRVGQYEHWTLVTFSNFDAGSILSLSFLPEVDRSTNNFNASDSGGSTIYLQADGQLRRLRYRYPDAKSSMSFSEVPEELVAQNADAIEIELPVKSREFTVRDGVLSVPPRLSATKRIFPSTGSGVEPFLELAYEVPPTDFQRLIVKWGSKTLGAILPLALLAFAGKKTKHARWRLVVASAGILLTLILISLIVWSVLASPEENDAIGESVLLFIGLSVSAIILFIKGEDATVGHTLESSPNGS